MALADRVAQRTAYTDVCPIGRLLAELDGEELAALKIMLGTPDNWGWNAPEIHATLREEGHPVGFKVINKHRGGNCRCAE